MAARLGNGTYHPASMSFWDKSGEPGNFEIYGRVVTATYVDPDVVNFTAQSVAWAALLDATQDIVRGLLRQQKWVNEVIVNAHPAQADIDQQAVREIKLEVEYIDSTTQKLLTATVPTLDLTKVTYLPQAEDYVAITTAQGAGAEIVAFVDAFEAYVVNPATGNGVTVIGLKVVGVNN